MGKMSSVTNTPPSKGVSSGPLAIKASYRESAKTQTPPSHIINASHSKKFSSDFGPTLKQLAHI